MQQRHKGHLNLAPCTPHAACSMCRPVKKQVLWLVDIFFVGLPEQRPLDRLADEATNALVEKFARLNG